MTMRAYTEGCRAMALVAAAAFDAAHHASRRRGAQAEPGLLRVHGAAGEGLQHRDEHRGREPRRAGARRHGLHRGDRRGAVPARRAHPDDLRRHDGDPGQRPGRPQDRARRRPRPPRRSPRRSRRPRPSSAQARQRRGAGDGASAWRPRARHSSRSSTSSSAARKANPNAVFAGSVPYLMLAGNLVAGWQMARALLVAEDQLARRATATPASCAPRSPPRASTPTTCSARRPAPRDAIVEGAESVTALALDAF